MYDQKMIIADLREQLKKARQSLLKDEIVSATECKGIVDKLETIKNISEPDTDILEEKLMSKNFEDLIADFNESAGGSTTLLHEMLSIISEGRVPEKDAVEELEETIYNLRKKYESIFQLVSILIPENEMPEYGSPVQVYTEAIEKSKTLQHTRLLMSAKRTLESFVSVQSLITAYSSALEPFQEQAKVFLNQINSGESADKETIDQKTAGPAVFLKALECQDFDSEDSMEILDILSEHYPHRVQAGITGHKYYIEQISDDNQAQDENQQDTPNVNETIEKKPGSEIDESSVVSGNAGDGQEHKDIAGDCVEPVEESDYVKAIYKHKALIQSEEVGSFTEDVYASENKKVTSSIFSGDMKKGDKTACKAIIGKIVRNNSLNLRFLTDVINMPLSIAENALFKLLNKGYLRKYSLEQCGSIYCASPRLMKAISFKEGSKFIGVKQRPVEDWGEEIEPTATSVASRIAFTEIDTDIIEKIYELGIPSYREQSFIDTNDFILSFSNENETFVLALGTFWDSSGECDEFLEIVEDYFADDEGISRLIIAGFNYEYAKANANALFDVLLADNVLETNVYLYGLVEKKYYSIDDSRQVSFDEIWPDEKSVSNDKTGNEIRTTEDTDNTNIGKQEETSDKTDDKKAEKKDSLKENQEESCSSDVNNAEKTSGKDDYLSRFKSLAAEEDKLNSVYNMLTDGMFYAAVTYSKAADFVSQEGQSLYNLLSYALNDPMAHCTYSTDRAYEMIKQRTTYEDILIIATSIRMFFSDQIRYDYNIKPFYNAIKDYPLLNNCPCLSNVVYILMDFKDVQKKGADAYAGYHAKSQTDLDKAFLKIRSEASDFYENFVVGRKKENASQKRFLETKKLMFSVNSDIGIYIKSIVDGDKEIVTLIEEFLQDNFMKEDSSMTVDSINSDKLWDYIVVFWEKAGDSMMYRRHADLMSHLRSNITSTTTKAIQLLVRWCALVDQANNHAEDQGTLAFKKIRKPLVDNLNGAIDEINNLSRLNGVDVRDTAAYSVLKNNIYEILRCIEGSYSENEHKYFYVPFLLTDEVILDENYMPDLDMHSSTVLELHPTSRINRHLNKMKANPTFSVRLAQILNEHGDDYGSAQLILNYLKDVEPSISTAELEEAITSGVNYAKETADLKKDDFIGELELAQSYGQIDNSTEDKKEKILQIVDKWYEWALETLNYGFFLKVMDAYLTEIKESAKSREIDLLEQLKVFQETQIQNLSLEDKNARIIRIKSMIDAQNYTVAEDLLARAQVAEEEHEEVIEENFLKDFLDNYEDYYRPVATRKSNFTTLVSSRTRNKEERGAKKMADNWLPGGSQLLKERLAVLLSCFGFKIEAIKQQPPIVRFENYLVTTATAKGGRADTYTHPIAAFGSGASREGFRVVCINGAYDADGLIDVMKQIGNAKHTIILHDYALSKSERRRLARKSKNALGDKFFGVIDRTVMMFLVRNYDETKINRMLISLIMPFGYYQPYVWESVNVMPPEIFMGRKNELEKIKSPTGVNIVYGGRQLGKSALLKKAKEDVDKNENGDRAIYIDIKGLNYEEAAQKIGHELFDQSVLDKDIDTRDWNELARAIRRRLQSNNKKIPYLLLLLDEADAFIESSERVNYKPLDALKDVQSIGVNRFKFVVAGLRNIVRFKKEAALGNNSVLTHLQAMTVKPFNTSEARELMEIPLHYLGLEFSKEKESLISLILASTNYFPGLIQMYCAKLLEAMRNKDYAGYDEVDTPIYEVSEDHIKRVLADPEFTQQIREKYIITLKLDEDNYYYLIALLMAYLYHNNGYSEGYSAEDIMEAGRELDVSKIADLDIVKLRAFMDELCELNVLRSTDDTHYLFTRFTFFQMMGTSSEVEDKIVEYMEG